MKPFLPQIFLFWLLFPTPAIPQLVGLVKNGDYLVAEIRSESGTLLHQQGIFVSQSGRIQLSWLGQEIKATGLTTKELASRIAKSYRNERKSDAFAACVYWTSPPGPLNSFSVGGEVKATGEYSVSKGLTLTAAVSRAGGLTEGTRGTRIELIRANKSTVYSHAVIQANPKLDPTIRTDDLIIVRQ